MLLINLLVLFDFVRKSFIQSGYPRIECFQVSQNCLKWLSLYFRSLFGKFGAALNLYLFGCLGGTLIVTNVLGGLFVSSEAATLMSPVERSGAQSSRTFIRKTFFNSNFNILVMQCEKHNPMKIVGTLLGKLRLSQRNHGAVVQKFFAFFEFFQACSRQYLLPQTVILPKIVVGCL